MLPSLALKGVSWVLFSCLLLLCQVQGEGPREKLSSPRVSCPRGSRAYGSYCYALFKTPKSWNLAEGLEPNAGGWVWSSTNVLDFFNWDRNPSTASDRGYCGSVTQTSGFLKWRDYDCNAELPYICKFKP